MQKLLVYNAETGVYVRSCNSIEEAAGKCKVPVSYIKRAIEKNWAANNYYIIATTDKDKISLKIPSRMEREISKGKAIEAFNSKGTAYRFKSVGEASKTFNISRAAIFHVLEKRQRKAAGFFWRRIQETDEYSSEQYESKYNQSKN